MIRRLLGCAPVLALACAPSTSPPAAPSGPPHWSYRGDDGPSRWGAIDPSFAACAAGQAQSPIDLPAHPTRATTKAPAPPKWDPVPLRVVNDGHTIAVDDTAPSSFVVDGVTYALEQLHFHSPSEHTIDGRAFDMEMHLVHASPTGKRLVVALLFQRGRDNEVLRPVWDAMPIAVRPEPVDRSPQTIDVQALLPKAPRYLRYDGSRTVPPCDEGVTWMVVEPDPDVPLQMSDAQIGRFRSVMQGPTNRPTQPQGGRVVVELTP